MKSVSILGSCNSRWLFNYEILKNNFDIKFYAFQINMWDIFSEGLDIPEEIINKIPVENFIRRMFDIDVNKKVKTILNTKTTEMIILDFYSLIRDSLKVYYKNKSVYINNNVAKKIKDFFDNNKNLNVKCETISFKKIDEKLIYCGIKKLAEYLLKIYKQENIIVVYPIFLKKYMDINNNIKEFNEKELKDIELKQNIINKFTDYFVSLISNCKCFKPSLEVDYSPYVVSDDYKNKPNFAHHTKVDEINMAYQLYNLIENKNEKFNNYEELIKLFNQTNNLLCKTTKVINDLNSHILTNLNNFIYKYIDLDKNIVIISAKDEASRKFHKFISRFDLGLKESPQYRQSYIAIIDKKNGYLFEKTSNEKIRQSYILPKNRIDIESAGYLSGNNSSIKINHNEYSKNNRGLNFVVLNNLTFEILYSFSCDLCEDDNLLISLD